MLRCLSNLLTEAAVEVVGGPNQLEDERVVAALFILLQFFLQKQPSLLPEGLWLLNNLTGMYRNAPRPRPLRFWVCTLIAWAEVGRIGAGQGDNFRPSLRNFTLNFPFQQIVLVSVPPCSPWI